MGGTTGTKDTSMTQEIEVEFDRVNDIAVDNRAGDTISASVTLIIPGREEANVMPLANDNKCDCGFYTQFYACLCVDIRKRTRHTGEETYFESGEALPPKRWQIALLRRHLKKLVCLFPH